MGAKSTILKVASVMMAFIVQPKHPQVLKTPYTCHSYSFGQSNKHFQDKTVLVLENKTMVAGRKGCTSALNFSVSIVIWPLAFDPPLVFALKHEIQIPSSDLCSLKLLARGTSGVNKKEVRVHMPVLQKALGHALKLHSWRHQYVDERHKNKSQSMSTWTIQQCYSTIATDISNVQIYFKSCTIKPWFTIHPTWAPLQRQRAYCAAQNFGHAKADIKLLLPVKGPNMRW